MFVNEKTKITSKAKAGVFNLVHLTWVFLQVLKQLYRNAKTLHLITK